MEVMYRVEGEGMDGISSEHWVLGSRLTGVMTATY